MKKILAIAVAALFTASAALGMGNTGNLQAKSGAAKVDAVKMTPEEERDMIKSADMLENYDVLLNMDMLADLSADKDKKDTGEGK
jgi:hypothetical protein